MRSTSALIEHDGGDHADTVARAAEGRRLARAGPSRGGGPGGGAAPLGAGVVAGVSRARAAGAMDRAAPGAIHVHQPHPRTLQPVQDEVGFRAGGRRAGRDRRADHLGTALQRVDHRGSVGAARGRSSFRPAARVARRSPPTLRRRVDGRRAVPGSGPAGPSAGSGRPPAPGQQCAGEPRRHPRSAGGPPARPSWPARSPAWLGNPRRTCPAPEPRVGRSPVGFARRGRARHTGQGRPAGSHCASHAYRCAQIDPPKPTGPRSAPAVGPGRCCTDAAESHHAGRQWPIARCPGRRTARHRWPRRSEPRARWTAAERVQRST